MQFSLCNEGIRPLSVFGIMHIFQKERLSEVNSIPKPSSSFERTLDRFVINFGPGSARLPINRKYHNSNNSEASAVDVGVLENGGQIRSEEEIKISFIK